VARSALKDLGGNSGPEDCLAYPLRRGLPCLKAVGLSSETVVQAIEHVCYGLGMGCVAGDRLAAALQMRRPELWDSNARLAERIEVRISDARRAHVHCHGDTAVAARCLREQHPELTVR